MAVFDKLNETSNKAVDVGETYIDKSEAYYKLKAFQVMSLSFTMITKFAIIGVFLLLALFLFSVAGAIALGNIVESISLGCIIVAVFYLLLAIVVYSIRSKIETLIIKKLSINYFTENE